MFPCEENHTNW